MFYWISYEKKNNNKIKSYTNIESIKIGIEFLFSFRPRSRIFKRKRKANVRIYRTGTYLRLKWTNKFKNNTGGNRLFSCFVGFFGQNTEIVVSTWIFWSYPRISNITLTASSKGIINLRNELNFYRISEIGFHHARQKEHTPYSNFDIKPFLYKRRTNTTFLRCAYSYSFWVFIYVFSLFFL